MEATRICSRCKEPKLLNENNFYRNPMCEDGYERQCKQCRTIKQITKRREKKNSTSKESIPCVSKQPVSIVTLDFSSHPHLLAGVTAMADKHFRTLEQQIMWLISLDCADQAGKDDNHAA